MARQFALFAFGFFVFRAIFFAFIVVIACIAGTVLVARGPFDLSAEAARTTTGVIWLAGLVALIAALVRRRLRAARR